MRNPSGRSAARFAGSSGSNAETKTALEPLTGREREVAELMASGMTSAQIANRLNISAASVKAHLSQIFTKLGVGNRVSAAMIVRDGSLR